MNKMAMIAAVLLVLCFFLAPQNKFAEAEKVRLPQTQWFFLFITSPPNDYGSRVPVVVGPFQEEAKCKEVSELVNNRNFATPCWPGNP